MAVVAESIAETNLASSGVRKAARRQRSLKLMDVGVLLGALIIFLLFLAILIRVVFPEGPRLGDMVVRGNATIGGANEVGTIDVDGGSVSAFGSFIAYLGDVRRDVKIRSANSVAWTNATEGNTVRNRDAVQTFHNSRARVDFQTDNELRIGQNSLVVFRSGAADPFLERHDSAVVVMSGELSGTVNADYGAFGVRFPAGLVELKAKGRSGEGVDFRVGVNPDESSTISILSGQADVNIAGEHYRVSADQGITITKDGRTLGVRALPALPAIREPKNNAIARYLATPPRVTFRWGEVANAQNYRLEIAEDSRFEEILVDEMLGDVSFTHGNLSSGDYFWRISARNGWVQGPASSPRRLSVVRDSVPPSLALEPIQDVSDGRYVLRGKTAPGSSVYVLGQRVETSPDGDFEHFFNPEPGSQSIVVESSDSVGNVAYSSQVIHVPGSAGRSD